MTTAPVHQTWKELVPLVRHGRLRTDGIFTHEFALAEAAAAYAAVADAQSPSASRCCCGPDPIRSHRTSPSRHRRSRRETTRRAVQVASTAQTLLSTRPRARASSRTTWSLMSVVTPDERFGQAIHSPPSGRHHGRQPVERNSRWSARVANCTTTSADPTARRFTVTPGGSSSSRPSVPGAARPR